MLARCENLQRFASIAQFSMHWGWQCAIPNELPDARPGDAPKAALLGLGGGVHAFFCLNSSFQCVGKRVAWIQ